MNSNKKQPIVRLANLLAVLADGSVVPLDISKVTIIDKTTQKALFKEAK